jgi:hypothetical protein
VKFNRDGGGEELECSPQEEFRIRTSLLGTGSGRAGTQASRSIFTWSRKSVASRMGIRTLR